MPSLLHSCVCVCALRAALQVEIDASVTYLPFAPLLSAAVSTLGQKAATTLGLRPLVWPLQVELRLAGGEGRVLVHRERSLGWWEAPQPVKVMLGLATPLVSTLTGV